MDWPLSPNQEALENYRMRFLASEPDGRRVVDFLSRNNVEIYRYEQDHERRWWLHLVLPPGIAEMFDTHLEVLCMYTTYDKVHPRTLAVLQQRLRSGVRVDPEFAIVFSNDKSLSQLVSKRRGELAILPIEIASVGTENVDLRTRMIAVLTALDHYDFTFPITEPSGFFGRRQEIDDLTFALDNGQPVGVFGLRKAGKTSLLNYVQSERLERGHPLVRLDLSEVSRGDEFRLLLIRRVYDLLRARGGKIPRLESLYPDGVARTPTQIELTWLTDLDKMVDAFPSRLEVIIDEIDQAYPERSTLGESVGRELFVALTQLRGLMQRKEADPALAGVVLLCAGVDPAIFEQPLLGHHDNLLYKMVRLNFLAPMGREEAAEMVRGIGKRMGLRYRDRSAIDFLYGEYGGHPLLTRKACSAAASQRPRGLVPWDVPRGELETAARRRGHDTPSGEAADVLQSFVEWFPREAELLPLLWSATESERDTLRAAVEDDPDSVKHIIGYGLANEDGSPRIRALLPFVLS